MKIVVIILGIIIIVILGVLAFVPAGRGPTTQISNASSTDEGIIEPAMSPDGHVEVSAPLAEDMIASPVIVAGNVTGGGWFFEASFPVKVVDADGTVLGQGPAQATSDWMTTGTVPFAAKITFAKPHSATGIVVLSKDNPSGDPSKAASFSVPVRFDVPNSGTGVVQGTVVLSPTCPVERIPSDPQCAPKPFSTTIGVSRNIETPTAFKTVQSDASGSFRFVLEPGEYDFFRPNGTSVYPRCEEKVITVVAGQTVDITISCDTGIR
jgi:hypothetical protein